jgi:replication fork clamp-binding protein CrfC
VDTLQKDDETETVDANEHVQALHDRIEEALRGSLDSQWDQVLDEWDEAAPSERKAVRAYVSGLRNRMLRALLDIETEEELERGLATQYIEVKCHWTMLNTQIQHQTARDGRAKDDLIYRATCVSLIIQNLEPLLSQERIDNLTAFLAEPLQ